MRNVKSLGQVSILSFDAKLDETLVARFASEGAGWSFCAGRDRGQQAGVQDTDVAKRMQCDSLAMPVRAEAAETNDNLRGTSRMAQVA